MIRRIVSIRNFQAFVNWRAKSGNVELRRVSLILGQNGSGKSTLSSLLGWASKAESDNYGLVLDVAKEDNPGSTRRVTDSADPFWARVRVFNGDFIRRSLKFDHEGGSEADALLVLGEAQIGVEERLKELGLLIEGLEKSVPESRARQVAAETAANTALTNTAKRVVEDLSTLGGRYRATNVYTRTQVAAVLDGDRAALAGGPVGEVELLSDLVVVKTANKPELAYESTVFPSLEKVDERIRELTLKTAAGQAINDLRSNPNLSAWAQAGIHLHDDRDTCAFCGNILRETRMDDLRAHFDESARQLQFEAEQLVTELRRMSEAATEERNQFPDADRFFPELMKLYEESKVAFAVDLTAYLASIEKLTAIAQSKVNRLFDSFDAATPDLGAAPNTGAIADVIAKHNARSSRFESLREQAGRRVELRRISDSAAAYDENKSLAGTYSKKFAVGEAKLAEHRAEVSKLSQVSGDPLPLAEELTTDVGRLLGRSDLSFVSQGGKYLIRRNGSPATGLSEGEKTAISLLYFLCSLNGKDGGKGLVVIVDDPVSSMDSNVLVGASAHLWSELVSKDPTRQVILFTHNFELFRIWSNQLDNSRSPKNTIQELRMVARTGLGGTTVRTPEFVDWPSEDHFRRKTRSEYHYLFWRVSSSLIELRNEPGIEAEAEAMMLIPNAARKMLEGFLSFKFPQHVGSFEESVEAAIAETQSALKERIVRFLHHHSHLAEGNTGAGIQPGEAVSVLQSVFELMDLVDHDHLIAMCGALGTDPARLVVT